MFIINELGPLKINWQVSSNSWEAHEELPILTIQSEKSASTYESPDSKSDFMLLSNSREDDLLKKEISIIIPNSRK